MVTLFRRAGQTNPNVQPESARRLSASLEHLLQRAQLAAASSSGAQQRRRRCGCDGPPPSLVHGPSPYDGRAAVGGACTILLRRKLPKLPSRLMTLRGSAVSAAPLPRPDADPVTGSTRVKRGMAEMLKGGVIMDVVTPDPV